MKPAALLFFLTMSAASAAVTVTPTNLGNLSKMPGLATDFTFFGNGTEFPTIPHYLPTNTGANPGTGAQPTVLTDFTVAKGSDATGQYGGDVAGYAKITSPAGTLTLTGDIFGGVPATGADRPNLVDFTLGKAGSTFDFSAFNVYVMWANAPGDVNDHDSALDYKLFASNGTTVLASGSVAVTQTNNSTSLATFEQFTITGAASGEILQLGAFSPAKSGGDTPYLGGVSFSEVPEPTTWAMMIAGCGFLVFRLRRKNP